MKTKTHNIVAVLLAAFTLSLFAQEPTPTPNPLLPAATVWADKFAAKEATPSDPDFIQFVEQQILPNLDSIKLPEDRNIQNCVTRYLPVKLKAGGDPAALEQIAKKLNYWRFLVAHLYTNPQQIVEAAGNLSPQVAIAGVYYASVRTGLGATLRNAHFQTLTGKGVTIAEYLDWFRAEIARRQPDKAVNALTKEIRGLLEIPATPERDAALVDLRGRLIVLKELAE